MKKKILKIIFILSFVFISISPIYNSTSVKADIGFDGDYDGGYDYGGNDSWGSYDDDDDDYYGGYYGNNNNNYNGGGGSLTVPQMLLLIFLSIIICAIPVILQMIVSKISSKRKERKRMMPPVSTYGMMVDEDLNMQVYLMYKELNDAWMNKDLEPVRHLLTDEMYNMYLMQLDTLIDHGQTNIMKDYKFISGHIAYKRKYKGIETIYMIFRIKCKDYIIDDTTKKVVRGKAKDVLDYTYELKLVRNVEEKEIGCPSCGYKLKNEDGVVCSHCGSVLHVNATNTLRLADKRMLRQVRSRR